VPWYATQQIRQGTALAYDVGHRVPDSNVETHGYDRDGLVAWVEPGDAIPAAPAETPLTGAFPNAPQRPEPKAEPAPPAAPVEEAADGTTKPSRRATADTTTSTEA
jgi:hypothetical protein